MISFDVSSLCLSRIHTCLYMFACCVYPCLVRLSVYLYQCDAISVMIPLIRELIREWDKSDFEWRVLLCLAHSLARSVINCHLASLSSTRALYPCVSVLYCVWVCVWLVMFDLRQVKWEIRSSHAVLAVATARQPVVTGINNCFDSIEFTWISHSSTCDEI